MIEARQVRRDAVWVFDIDNTLTPPRLPLEKDMADLLGNTGIRFCVDGGSSIELVEGQLLEPLWRHGFRGQFDAFLCNGARRYRCVYGAERSVELIDDFSMRDALGDTGWQQFLDLIGQVLHGERFELAGKVPINGPQVTDRGAMINVAPGGRPLRAVLDDADIRARDAFVAHDRATGYRRAMIDVLNAGLAGVDNGAKVEICLGGNTSLDIGIRGRDKSYALQSLFAEGAPAIVYLGDALFPGGNDEAVLKYAERMQGAHELHVVAVESHATTRALLTDLLPPAA